MANFVSDTFTDTNGVGITSHTGETGATWTKHSGANNTTHPAISSNMLVTGDNNLNEIYYASGVPASADYTVALDYTFNNNSNNEIAGPAGRMATGANTGYFFIYFKTVAQVRLYKYVTGTLTQIGSGVSFTPSNGVTYRLTLGLAATAITGKLQRLSDSEYLQSGGTFSATEADCISSTDADISAAGRAGFWISTNPGSGSRGTIDDFSADTSSAAATAVTMSGPTTGTTGVASTDFTIGANGDITGTVVVTPSDGGAGGTFTPTTVSINTGSPTGTFTYTAASAGAKTISVTNDGGLSNPSNITYTASDPLKYTLVDTTDTIGAQNIRVLVPNSNAAVPYNASNPTPVVLYVHGSGETQTALLADSLKATCVDALLDAGYILAGTNARGNNWGTQQSADDYVALEKYVRDNYNVQGVALWAQSMGGLNGLQVLAQGKFTVVGWLGTYPVVSLSNLYGLGTYAGAIDTAHGITGSGIATYANKTRGLDPALYPGFSWRHVPMRIYASSSDTVVPKANNGDVLAALVAGSTREAVMVACTGNHGDASHFVPAEYVAFFDRCFATPVATGKPSATKTVSITLTTDGTTPAASLTGLKWSWWDQITPDVMEWPTDKGTGESTDGSGVLSITVASNLDAADIGWLVVTDSDGTTTQSPAHKLFSGPVAVS